MLARLQSRVDEAVDFAILQGLLRRTAEGGLIHMPFALTPCPVDAEAHARMEALSQPFNRLAHSVSRRLDFLHDALAEVTATDPFTRDLLRLARAGAAAQPLYFQITRSDYFLTAASTPGPPAIRQVELNTISASFPGAAAAVNRLHRLLLSGSSWAAHLIPNDPIPMLVRGFVEAHRAYGHPDACVLVVVQPGESNVFDQRMLEAGLQAEGLAVVRMTLEEIAARATLREGHLTCGGAIAAITYFRAGYAPQDYPGPDALRAREMIEHASTISVPSLATHLAGTKKVQQLLTHPGTLREFCDEADAVALEGSFAGIYDLDERIEGPDGLVPAWQAARAAPERFVLKPQREGGGNNLYEAEMTARLAELDGEARKAFILMERIEPIPHPAVLVMDGRAQEGSCVSEIGRFGVFLADGDEVLLNGDAGYLVRSKGHQVREGGVSAGFGHLNSLIAFPPGQGY